MEVFIQIPGTIVIRNRKIVWKYRSYLLIFCLELEIFGIHHIWDTENTSKQQKMVVFVRNCLVKMTLRLFLASFCCYDYGANASEADQKISTRTLELYANSLKQLIL